MNIEKFNDLGKRALKILPIGEPLEDEEIKFVEKSLDIQFPADFKMLSKYISYEYFDVFPFLNFRKKGPESVIYSTLGLYEYLQYKNSYIILYQDDAGIIIMKDISSETSSIYWCAIEEVENIVKGLRANYDYKFFPTFAAFFEYLLDEEEKLRAEENSPQ